MSSTEADLLRTMSPQLIADVVMYRTSAGGKKQVAQPGWGCPCMVFENHNPHWLGCVAAAR